MTNRTITKSEYLQALGLFTLANNHYMKMRDAELALNDLIDIEDGSFVGDALLEFNASSDDFNRALAHEKIFVSDS